MGMIFVVFYGNCCLIDIVCMCSPPLGTRLKEDCSLQVPFGHPQLSIVRRRRRLLEGFIYFIKCVILWKRN